MKTSTAVLLVVVAIALAVLSEGALLPLEILGFVAWKLMKK